MVVRRALFIAANAADFPANRYFLRRAGCIPALNRFLSSLDGDLLELSEKALGKVFVEIVISMTGTSSHAEMQVQFIFWPGM